MSANSKIAWTDTTWNPVTGCTKVSPGCDHCYAEVFAERWRGVKGHPFEQGFDLVLRPGRLSQPMHWRKPRRIFVNSMSDLFHRGDIPDDFIRRVFDTIGFTERHIFQVLTKRPERMRRAANAYYGAFNNAVPGEIPISNAPATPFRNLWLGVSIENNDYAWRADMSRETLAAVRFISFEPLLGPVDRVSLEGHHWVIVGGESGWHHRPMDLQWARDVRDRCKAAGIAYFFKQVGALHPSDDMIPEDLRIREFPA